ncbi:RusA family crossover junction endodeoxyribonuclease [Streptomyces sp. ME18-1-4]|uniref:RusA family crossover junction endodeoxyribonuclease n=1 Tax=Streptomyces sp. ME18-1-4 TaxID=3028685 RepID=UPI0029A481DF|nr:RusA family crossover junction endodeoxyribonuclease [Streptomyces sp. ME18-1-4]MDX3248819.1 RusA family crossover junction endodeoxyribonuclease [Streptomyces sp. ME18-1-4]
MPASGPRPAAGISFPVYGLPAPQGSKRHVGNGVMIESSAKVKPWRQDVKQAALDAVAALPGWTPLDGPLVASMIFTFARPKGHYRTGRNAHLLRDSAPSRPAVTPDLSKILRSTEDALTGVIWADDARVVGYAHLGKYYADNDAADVLTMPGAVIRVWPLPEAVTL